MNKIILTLNTIKYMTFKQWFFRIYYMVRNKLICRKVTTRKKIESINLLHLRYKEFPKNNTSIEVANEIISNEFRTVSGKKFIFNDRIDWDRVENGYRLPNFKLNSFDWLIYLSDAYKITKDVMYIEKGFELIDDWSYNCGKLIDGEKWNPYVIALRLMNWIGFCSEYCAESKRDILIYSQYILNQAIELKKSIEYQLSANHVLSEAKALLVAGCFLNETKYIDFGYELLLKEYNVQFLDDGGHYERSISYHIESLQQYYEAIVALNVVNDVRMYKLINLVKPAYIFLLNMIDVKGCIPLINDSAVDYPFDCAVDFVNTANYLYEPQLELEDILAIGDYSFRWKTNIAHKQSIEWQMKELFSNTGIMHHRFTVQDKKYSLFYDFGNCGPDNNLGHAHADMLQILLSDRENNIIVDSGVFTYNKNEDRDYCRSTSAHNTIEIDNVNSIEVWGAFRTARRGHGKLLDYKKNDEFLYISGEHDGYCKTLKNKVTHKREITERNGIIEIVDTLSCSNVSTHYGVSRFHLAPDCLVKKIDENIVLVNDDVLFIFDRLVDIEECQIATKFGIKEISKCLVLKFKFKNDETIKTKIKLN